jgi:hypothetical protein
MDGLGLRRRVQISDLRGFAAVINLFMAVFYWMKYHLLRGWDALEHFQKNCSRAVGITGSSEYMSGLFDFWLHFGSVTGFYSNLRLRQSLAKNQKSSLHAGYSFSSNALQSGGGPPQSKTLARGFGPQ